MSKSLFSKSAMTRLETILAILVVILAGTTGYLAYMVSRPGPPEKVTITFSYNMYMKKSFGPAPPPWDALVEAVGEEYPNIELVFLEAPCEVGPWHDMYATWFMAEDPTVDILGVGMYWVQEFCSNGWILPLDDFMTPEFRENLLEEQLAVYSYEGKVYGFPWWAGIGGLYYRADLLDEYGFDPPETYDDLVTIAETILEDHPEMTGYTWPAKKDQALVNCWKSYLKGFGGTSFDEGGRCTMNSPEGVAALQFMVDLIESGISPPEITTWKEEDAMVRFLGGEAIFHLGRNDIMLFAENPDMSNIVGKWGFIKNPAQPGGRHTGTFEGFAFGINAFSDNPEEAWKVLEVFGSFEIQKIVAISQGPIEPHKDVYTDPDVLEVYPKMPILYDVLETADGPIPTLYHAEVSGILQEELHAALSGIKTPKEALDDACARIDEVHGF